MCDRALRRRPTHPSRRARLLDAAGAEQAHVVGLSFGGAIAQEIAIPHPQRIRSLVLASSTAGGERYVPADRAIRDFLGRLAELPAEEGLWASVPYLYATTTYRRHAPLIGEDIAHRLTRPLDPRSYDRQHAAARAHDAGARLAEIAAPTLVLHGERGSDPAARQRTAAGRRHRGSTVRAGCRAVPTPSPPTCPARLGSWSASFSQHSPRRAGSAARRTGRATRA